MLLTRGHGYLIDADPESVDAWRFQAAVDEARTRLRDDPAAAAEILRGGLALWRGPALQDFVYDEFARAEISRLDELRLDAEETRIDAELRCGLANEIVGELEMLVQSHPLRERPVAQLMHALYRAGRQAEALRTFQRFRHGIGEELGIEPSPELVRLEEQILLHDARLQPPSTVRANPASTAEANPFKGLHAFEEADADDFFGRDRLIADVLGRVGNGARLVTLVGPSGWGKSSVVRAGIVAALRDGAVPGSEQWPIATMVPGAHPFAELEAALLSSTTDARDSLAAQFEDETLGLLRGVLCVLPPRAARLVLVIDQFEELFTLVGDETERQRFVANLVAALAEPGGRLLVLLTLRADSYHHPLAHAEFARHPRPERHQRGAVDVGRTGSRRPGTGGRQGCHPRTGAARRVVGGRDRRARGAANLPVRPHRAVRSARRRRPHGDFVPGDGRRAGRAQPTGRRPVPRVDARRAGGGEAAVLAIGDDHRA